MATIKEKPKKQPGVMHVYEMDTGAGGMTPESPFVTKKMVSSWGMLRRSKTYRENEHDQLKPGKTVNNVVVSEGRKSVSVLDARKSSAAATINEGRKSVSSKAEGINVGAVAAFMKVKVLVTDMPGFMQVHAFRRARQSYDSFDKFSSKNMACDMKKEFDKVYGPAWHCIVGSSFGSFVTHSTGCFLYFTMEKLYVLVFKTKVQKAEA